MCILQVIIISYHIIVINHVRFPTFNEDESDGDDDDETAPAIILTLSSITKVYSN